METDLCIDCIDELTEAEKRKLREKPEACRWWHCHHFRKDSLCKCGIDNLGLEIQNYDKETLNNNFKIICKACGKRVAF